MKNLKRLSVLIVGCFLVLFIITYCCCLNCGKDKKYDVTIKIMNNFDSEWVFTPDVEEMTYEFEYTGKEMYFYVDSYNLPKHPQWKDKWFTPKGEGANAFTRTMSYREPGGKFTGFTGAVKEIGEYNIAFTAEATSDIWKFREVYLCIKVI